MSDAIFLRRCRITHAYDAFVLRRSGRDVAEAVGLGQQDRIRVATALSDIGRESIEVIGPADAVFTVERDVTPALLVVSISWDPDRAGTPATALTAPETGARLVDRVERGGHSIVLHKRLGATRTADDAWSAEVSRRVAATRPRGTFDELRVQKQELLTAPEEFERGRDKLPRLNAELAETDQGVVALYRALSMELAETNRGVVALYAESAEKTGQLRAAGETGSRFRADVGHELRTPADSAIGLARLLPDPAGDPLTDYRRGQSEPIASSGATLLGMVDELREMARAESGRVGPQPAAVDLAELPDRVTATIRPMVTAPTVTFHIERPDPLPSLVTDEVTPTRILHNLLSNAVKYPRSGEIRLCVAHEPWSGLLEFTVRDTGPGIPLGQQERVFEAFYRVPGPLGVTGTGPGLPYARGLTEPLGGTLSPTGAPGTGTTVTLRLPTGFAGLVPRRVGTALLVDDDPACRELFDALSRGLVDRLVSVADGAEGVTTAAACGPEVIFLDLRMPGVHGYTLLLRRLADHPRLRDVPVVVVTSTDPIEAAGRIESAGAASVLAKRGLTTAGLAKALNALPSGGAP